ncbi:hypothetical protein COV24_05010 [candidate division WWE3 bacterium CG10_big_fil_rev_8_21_14_0_10_32_10]|uniref:Undecaprenyldiphospho-muramoylpentapeptide beta-N-acetylglucosaminyltransferase n=1 Tax=candidate division WWE3 bacterium CG10_big_fil_rev_8_21_14_0_10_32_10 TaxID=1975090 RepID=A0A2H0RAY9_UNCKA|nr:MAG: hypothetical protein COV24_05010 [candidate division WWE3 bacterium CG10_big_fil_rev_8_21_14_0_10_32_10]
MNNNTSKTNYDILFVGGHHNSSLPLIQKFMKDGYSIKFIGHKYASKLNDFVSSEYTEMQSYGIPYINLNTPKFYNNNDLLKYIQLLKSVVFCFKLFISERPSLIMSFGGYLAVPVVIAGKLLNIKIATHEQTAVKGLANNMIAKFADKIYLTWDISKKHYTNKSEVVGLPIREEILSVKKNKPNAYIKTIFVQGGKQGSHIINDFIFSNIDYLCSKYVIYHQTGKHSINDDHVKAEKLSKKYPNYKTFTYLYGKDYTKILNKVDLVLGRSGAHMVYELAYLKIPAIFVPISWSSNNEQYFNAKLANEYLPCYIIEEKNLNISNFKKALKYISTTLRKNTSYLEVTSKATEAIYTSIKKNFFNG